MDITTYRAKAAEVAALEAEAVRLDDAVDAAAKSGDRAAFVDAQVTWCAAFAKATEARRALAGVSPVWPHGRIA